MNVVCIDHKLKCHTVVDLPYSVHNSHRQPHKKGKNHGTQDSRVVPHRGTNWAALRLTAQIKRDAVLSESYGRG